MRENGRKARDFRPVTFEVGVQRDPAGSVLVSFGATRVLCSVTIEDRVPPFLRDKGEGWLTAEYSMLPGSSSNRINRNRGHNSGRSQEISRLIGRSLRMAIDRTRTGQRTFTVDCDVLQADGGTRTAAITGSWVALSLAVRKLMAEGRIKEDPMVEQVAAVSVGLGQRGVLVDLDYVEDSSCRADVNLVGTASGDLIEVQGTAENGVIRPAELDRLVDAGRRAIRQLAKLQDAALSV